MSPRSILRRDVAVLIITLLIASLAGAPPAPAKRAAGATYTVDSTLDEPDANPADGKCVSFPSLKCTLRAAIMRANFDAGPDTIIVPAGVYTLTASGDDDAALVGDLDIKYDVTIVGAGSGTTIVDANGAVTHDRAFQVLSTAQNVTLSGLTIRGGQALSEAGSVAGGGGLALTGAAHLSLSDVLIEDNTGVQQGGGLLANFAAGGGLTLDHVVLRANSAVPSADSHQPQGDGGGAWVVLLDAADSFDLHDSQIYSNTAADRGGGLHVISGNTAPITIERSTFYSNTAQYGGGVEIDGSLALSDSQVHDNHATYYGGGAAIEQGAAVDIARTTVAANSAGLEGGGLYMLEHLNTTPGLTIVASTISGNGSGQDGGGIYNAGDGTFISSALVLVNSTVSGNGANHDGGGLYTDAGQTELSNATLAYNRVSARIGHADLGAGMFLTHTAVLTGDNSIIADNFFGVSSFSASDCYSSASTVTLLYSLLGDTSNCPLSGAGTGNLLNTNPLLSPLADNGGPTLTQALEGGSPAINAADPAGCSDGAGGRLATDQRGAPRSDGQCDMGAYELVPQADLAVGQAASPSPAQLGAPLAYTVTVTNAGPDPASAVALTDTLPAGATPPAVSLSEGICNGVVPVTVLHCSLTSLASGGQWTVAIVVTPTIAGRLTNVAAAGAGQFDPALANNSASFTTTVLRQLFLPLIRR